MLEHKSVMLFGPRQTGKSSLIRNQLSGIVQRTYNLLDQGLLRRLLADPGILRQELAVNDFRDEEGALAAYIVVCRETVPRRTDGIDILPWQVFLERLWSGILV